LIFNFAEIVDCSSSIGLWKQRSSRNTSKCNNWGKHSLVIIWFWTIYCWRQKSEPAIIC